MSVFYGVKLDLDFREFELFLKEREGRLSISKLRAAFFLQATLLLPISICKANLKFCFKHQNIVLTIISHFFN